MSYSKLEQLPKGVKENLPQHAQEIYKEAFNSAMETYEDEKDTEVHAHRVAWSAVKSKYEKIGETWRRKDSNG